MSDFREEEKLGKIYDTHLTRRIIKYLRPYRWHVTLAVSMSLVYMGMVSAGPYLFHVAIDWYIVPGLAHSITTKKALTGLFWTVFAYTASLLLSFGVQFVQVRIMQWVGQETMYDLRKEIFEHLQRLPMSFFDRTPVGRLVTRSTTDVDALNDLFASGVVAMLNDFVLLFGLAIFLLSWHFYLGLATLSPLPFMILLTYFFRNHVRDANRRIRTAIARINGFLQEHISGMAVVQLFNRERESREQFANFNRIHMEAYKDAIDAFSYFLSGCRIPQHGRHRSGLLGGRRARDRRHSRNRRACLLHAVRATLLPADSGPERKIQHSAGRHGRLRAHLPTAR